MSPCAHVGWPTRVASLCSTYSSTAVQWVQQQYSRFAVLVQQYSQYSCTRIGQRRLYFSTAVQHSTAVQQYSSSTAVQQTAGAQPAPGFARDGFLRSWKLPYIHNAGPGRKSGTLIWIPPFCAEKVYGYIRVTVSYFASSSSSS